MPLNTTPSDTLDTTEEAILALVAHLYASVEANAGLAAEIRDANLDGLQLVADSIRAGQHWNVPVATSMGATQLPAVGAID